MSSPIACSLRSFYKEVLRVQGHQFRIWQVPSPPCGGGLQYPGERFGYPHCGREIWLQNSTWKATNT